MTEKNRNLIVRVGSAVVLLPAVLYLMYLGGYWTAALLGVAAANARRPWLRWSSA